MIDVYALKYYQGINLKLFDHKKIKDEYYVQNLIK